MDDNLVALRWSTLETETARIHFPVSRWGPGVDATPVARRVASEVDPLWTAICDEVGHRPAGPIHIVVLEHTDQLEGFTLPSDDWVVFSGHPGADLARMRGRADWIPDLLAHELAHVATDGVARTFPRPLAGLGVGVGGVVEAPGLQVGGELTLSDADPYWFSEGVAELVSEAVGVNRWTPARAMTLRASVLDGRLLEPERWGASRLLDDWYDGERAYQEGYAFLRWLREDQGAGVVRALLEASHRRFRTRWEDVFEEVTGESFELLHARFVEHTRREARRTIARLERKGVVEGEELATWELAWQAVDLRGQDRWLHDGPRERETRQESTGTWNLHARWSADGTWFARNRGGWVEVREQDEDLFRTFAGETPDWDRTSGQRRDARRLSAWLPSVRGMDFAFVPGRDAVVVTQQKGELGLGRARRTWNELVVVDLTPVDRPAGPILSDSMPALRRRTRSLPGTSRGFDPAVTEDGRVVFSRYEQGSANLWATDLDGGAPRRLTAFADGTWVEGTSLSPDGRQAVVTLHRRDAQDLWLLDLATGMLDPLVTSPVEEVDPFWAADGSIWFAADVEGIPDIFRWTPGGDITRMTRVRTGAASPVVTPDGDLVYSQFTGFGWKTVGLRASELLWEPVDYPRQPGAERRPETTGDGEEPRPYRAYRSVLGPSLSPSLRLDRQVDGRWFPRVGLFLRLRDAVENHTLTAQAWAGRDVYLRGRYVWHGLWPDLGLSFTEARTWTPGETARRRLTTWSADARLPLRGTTSVALSVGGYDLDAVAGRHRTRLATLSVDTGPSLRRPERRGTRLTAVATRAWSNGVPWSRLEAYVESVGRAPVGGDDEHRLLASLAVGVTDRAVGLPDRLRLGGDHPDALRTGLVQATIPLPGYAPYAFSADQVLVTGGGWRAPLARRLGQRWGNGVVDEVRVEVGAHVGAARLLDGGTRTLGDVHGGVRIGAVFLGRPIDVRHTVAWGAPRGEAGGLRTILSFGAGW